MRQHGYIYKIIMLKERNHKKESIVYDSFFFFLILESTNSSSDRKHISGCTGWGADRSKKAWIIWGDDRNVHYPDSGTGFTAIYICQNLSNHTYVQFIACQSYLNKADLKIVYSTCFT